MSNVYASIPTPEGFGDWRDKVVEAIDNVDLDTIRIYCVNELRKAVRGVYWTPTAANEPAFIRVRLMDGRETSSDGLTIGELALVVAGDRVSLVSPKTSNPELLPRIMLSSRRAADGTVQYGVMPYLVRAAWVQQVFDTPEAQLESVEIAGADGQPISIEQKIRLKELSKNIRVNVDAAGRKWYNWAGTQYSRSVHALIQSIGQFRKLLNQFDEPVLPVSFSEPQARRSAAPVATVTKAVPQPVEVNI